MVALLFARAIPFVFTTIGLVLAILMGWFTTRNRSKSFENDECSLQHLVDSNEFKGPALQICPKDNGL